MRATYSNGMMYIKTRNEAETDKVEVLMEYLNRHYGYMPVAEEDDEFVICCDGDTVKEMKEAYSWAKKYLKGEK